MLQTVRQIQHLTGCLILLVTLQLELYLGITLFLLMMCVSHSFVPGNGDANPRTFPAFLHLEGAVPSEPHAVADVYVYHLKAMEETNVVSPVSVMTLEVRH